MGISPGIHLVWEGQVTPESLLFPSDLSPCSSQSTPCSPASSEGCGCMLPGAALNVWTAVSHLIVPTAAGSKYLYPQFTEGETGSERLRNLPEGHTSSKWQRSDLKAGLISEPVLLTSKLTPKWSINFPSLSDPER